MSNILPQAVVEQRLAELAREREQVLTGYVPEVEAARRLNTSRQALHKRHDRFKREIGGVRSSEGWFYREDKLAAHLRHRQTEAGQAAPFVQGATT